MIVFQLSFLFSSYDLILLIWPEELLNSSKGFQTWITLSVEIFSLIGFKKVHESLLWCTVSTWVSAYPQT